MYVCIGVWMCVCVCVCLCLSSTSTRWGDLVVPRTELFTLCIYLEPQPLLTVPFTPSPSLSSYPLISLSPNSSPFTPYPLYLHSTTYHHLLHFLFSSHSGDYSCFLTFLYNFHDSFFIRHGITSSSSFGWREGWVRKSLPLCYPFVSIK